MTICAKRRMEMTDIMEITTMDLGKCLKNGLQIQGFISRALVILT
jgi:hypothetical protein